MHPPLHKPSTEAACRDVIAALENCHGQWKKWVGGCNMEKINVNACLHDERVARAKAHREDAREKKIVRDAKIAAILKDLDADEATSAAQ